MDLSDSDSDSEEEDITSPPSPVALTTPATPANVTSPLSDGMDGMEHESDGMTLTEMLRDFKLNSKKLHAYFRDELGIALAKDVLKHSPTDITQPAMFRSTKMRMRLTKMAKFVTTQVLQNYWDGPCATQWATLDANSMTTTFGVAQKGGGGGGDSPSVSMA